MAHTYGTLEGSRGRATRLGNKDGIRTQAASRQGCVESSVRYDDELGIDIASVSLERWRGRGIEKDLYHGPVGGDDVELPRWSRNRLRKWEQIIKRVDLVGELIVSKHSFRIWRQGDDKVLVERFNGEDWIIHDGYTAKAGEGLK